MHLARFRRIADYLYGFMLFPMHVHIKNYTSKNSSSPNWHIIRLLLGHFLHEKTFLSRQIDWFNNRTLNFWNLISLKSFNQHSFFNFGLKKEKSTNIIKTTAFQERKYVCMVIPSENRSNKNILCNVICLKRGERCRKCRARLFLQEAILRRHHSIFIFFIPRN
ncbi:hypothetical protein TorRG33x02_155550 [Trema orientale]|uniref:Uncharacterized protein n=1 Tax=Trema orientale TaxID=63057 RepID=A0A2P5ESX9_TREOI|nr:hypothetical protein TorRG33x02_155550 [Trema orientale]